MNKQLHIISYSGGIGSAVSCLLAHKYNLNYEVIFADTLIEDEDLYRFNNDIASVIGKQITWLSCGMNPWDVYVKERYIGNSRTAHCSQRLKTDVVREHICSFYATLNPVLILGMSLEEQERIERAKKNWAPIEVDSLLMRYKCNSRQHQEEMLAAYGIALPRLYSYGFPHNNCGGFCCRSGQTQFASLLKHFPERYQWHVEQEERAYKAIGATAKPFIRQTVNGELRYLRMSEFRSMVESGELTPPLYDFGGCACFIDEVDSADS
jgi:hypothetical protein